MALVAAGSSSLRALTLHDGANELYDCGAVLVACAADLRRAAADPAAVEAIPAVLGCLDTFLRDLAAAADGLKGTLQEATPQAAPSARDGVRAARAELSLAHLQQSLIDAADAAAAARPLAARVLEHR